MTKTVTEVKNKDFLDEFKDVERAIRARALTKMLATLKEKAHEVLELKEYTNAVLEELGVEEADCKRLIDWVNSLEQVKLSKKDREDIREEAREDVRTERKEAEKKLPEFNMGFVGYSQPMGTGHTGTSFSGGLPATTFTTAANSISPLTYTALHGENSFKVVEGASSMDIRLK